jgi:hypothetical protein
MIKLIVDLHPIVKNRTAVESLSTLYIPMKAHTLMQAIPRASADSDAITSLIGHLASLLAQRTNPANQ